ERLMDLEGGYEMANAVWSAGVNAYYMRYKDQLVLTGKINDVGAYARTNVPNSYRAGIELQGNWKPAAWISAAANATSAQNKIERFTEYIDNYDDGTQQAVDHGTTDIAFSPSVIAGGGVTLTPFAHSAKWKSFGMELLGKYVSRQYLDNTGDERRSIDPYAL